MVVMPDEMASTAPSRALSRYSSGVSDALTSTRLMIQSPNSASSRMPRNERVLDVAVAVDEAGHDDGLAEVDDRRARVLGDQPRRGADGHDAPAGHGDAAVRQDGAATGSTQAAR